jgi:hypothetical protein
MADDMLSFTIGGPLALRSSTAAVRDAAVGGLAETAGVDAVDDEFLALVYSDEELLREEFDALMAAAWSPPPAGAAGPGRGAERPPDGPRPDADGRLSPGGVGHRSRDIPVRTRAPPDAS